jgi:hypothetical protein
MGWEDREGKRREGMCGMDGMRERRDGSKCQEEIERDDEKGIEGEEVERDWEEKDWEGMGRMRRNGNERKGMGRYVGKGEEENKSNDWEGTGRDVKRWRGKRYEEIGGGGLEGILGKGC